MIDPVRVTFTDSNSIAVSESPMQAEKHPSSALLEGLSSPVSSLSAPQLDRLPQRRPNSEFESALEAAHLSPLTRDGFDKVLLSEGGDVVISNLRILSRDVSIAEYAARFRGQLTPAHFGPEPKFIAICHKELVPRPGDPSPFFDDLFSAVSAASKFASHDPLGRMCILRISEGGEILPLPIPEGVAEPLH